MNALQQAAGFDAAEREHLIENCERRARLHRAHDTRENILNADLGCLVMSLRESLLCANGWENYAAALRAGALSPHHFDRMVIGPVGEPIPELDCFGGWNGAEFCGEKLECPCAYWSSDG